VIPDPARRGRRQATIVRRLMGSLVPHLLAPLLRGRGIVFCGHRVLRRADVGFPPTRALAISRSFLDRLIGHLRGRGVELIGLDDLPARLAMPCAGAPFAHFSFDDGYADMLNHALPVFEHHGAPFSLFITTGFVERTHLMWWAVLEQAIADHDRVELADARWTERFPTGTPAEKAATYAALEARCRCDPGAADTIVGQLAAAHGPALAERARARALTWPMLAALARSPLVAIGCHGVSHAPLAQLDDRAAATELARARTLLETRLDRPVTALAYPYGDPASVGRRTIALAKASGFTLGFTTERGMVRAADRERPLALPRTSLNGWHEDLAVIDFHLTGLTGLSRRRVAA
jgi:peptidoglycan/xylan/chitin deacetylase (PgdA/CDA1 family)